MIPPKEKIALGGIPVSAGDIFLWWLLSATFGRLSGTLACCKPCLWVPPSPIITSLYYKGWELWLETLIGLGLSHHLEPWAPRNPPGPEGMAFMLFQSEEVGSSETQIPWPRGEPEASRDSWQPLRHGSSQGLPGCDLRSGLSFYFLLQNKGKLSKKKGMHSFIKTKHFVTKDHILCDSVYMSVQNRQNYKETRYINGCSGPGSKRVSGWKKMGSDCQWV